MKLVLGLLTLTVLASGQVRDGRQLFSSSGLVFPGPPRIANQQQQQLQQLQAPQQQQRQPQPQPQPQPQQQFQQQQRQPQPQPQQQQPFQQQFQQQPPRPQQRVQNEPLVAQQSAKAAVQVDSSPFVPAPNGIPNRPVISDGPIFRTPQQGPPSRPNQFLNPNFGFEPNQRPPFPLAAEQQFQDRPNPFRDEIRQQPERPVPPPSFAAPSPTPAPPREVSVPTYRPTVPQPQPQPQPTRPPVVRTTYRPPYQPEIEEEEIVEEEEVRTPPPRPLKVKPEAPRRPEPVQQYKKPSDTRPQPYKKQQEKPKKRKPTTTTPAPVEEYEEEEAEEEEVVPDQLTLRLQETDFTCRGKKDGYYADETLNCEVFHYCQDGIRHSWLCPVGASFHQVHLICMPVSDDNICKKSSQFHFVNEYLYRQVNEGGDNSTGALYADRYYPDGYEHGVPFDMDKVEAPRKPEYKPFVQSPQNVKKQIYRESQRPQQSQPAQRPQQPQRVQQPQYSQQPQRVQRPQQPQFTQARQNAPEVEPKAPEVQEEAAAESRTFTEEEEKSEASNVNEQVPAESADTPVTEEKPAEDSEGHSSLPHVIQPAASSSEEVISS